MIIFVPVPESDLKNKVNIPKFEGVKMPLEEFYNWETENEPEIKYEWDDGRLEADFKMKPEELNIYKNILRKFNTTKYVNLGVLVTELDFHLKVLDKVRRPDICYVSNQNIKNPRNSPITEFVIEIISPNNESEKVERKMKEYFLAGVKCVWHIYPNLKEVRIYSSAKKVEICTDVDICGTNQVIPDLQISVNDIFMD